MPGSSCGEGESRWVHRRCRRPGWRCAETGRDDGAEDGLGMAGGRDGATRMDWWAVRQVRQGGVAQMVRPTTGSRLGVGVKLGERGGEFGGVRENSGRTLGEFDWGRVDSSSRWEIRKDITRTLQGGDGKDR